LSKHDKKENSGSVDTVVDSRVNLNELSGDQKSEVALPSVDTKSRRRASTKIPANELIGKEAYKSLRSVFEKNKQQYDSQESSKEKRVEIINARKDKMVSLAGDRRALHEKKTSLDHKVFIEMENELTKQMHKTFRESTNLPMIGVPSEEQILNFHAFELHILHMSEIPIEHSKVFHNKVMHQIHDIGRDGNRTDKIMKALNKLDTNKSISLHKLENASNHSKQPHSERGTSELRTGKPKYEERLQAARERSQESVFKRI
jgi:hypothetical protein